MKLLHATKLTMVLTSILLGALSSRVRAEWDFDTFDGQAGEILAIQLDTDDDLDETHLLIDEVDGEIVIQVTEYRDGLIVDVDTRYFDLGQFNSIRAYGGTNSVNVMRNPTFRHFESNPVGGVSFYGGDLDDDLRSANGIWGGKGDDVLENAIRIFGEEGDDQIRDASTSASGGRRKRCHHQFAYQLGRTG